MWDIRSYQKDIPAKYPAYKLDHIVIETVEDILKDIPEFADYFSICHKQAKWEWDANYKKGQQLAQTKKKLLAEDEVSIVNELLTCAPRKDALGESRWEFVKKYEEHIQSFFFLHLAAMSSKTEVDDRFAYFFGIQDGKPSAELLALAETYIIPVAEQPCEWSPFFFMGTFFT